MTPKNQVCLWFDRDAQDRRRRHRVRPTGLTAPTTERATPKSGSDLVFHLAARTGFEPVPPP